MPVEPFDDDKLFELACIGARRLGELVDATGLGVLLDEDTSRLREQAEVGLSAMTSNLLLQAPRHHVPVELLKELERWVV